MSKVHPATRRARRLRAEGKCTNCGNPRDCISKTYCLFCLRVSRQNESIRKGYSLNSNKGPLTIEERMKPRSSE